ncbi:tetratricopeptide repeat protein, partial [uncultured Ruminococcus sp.]|uniref:tetratricopeptide repeat protein n=1 Tax=uncultured Ruminococcus sp. TaxID=165186 RepID=UPI0025EF98CE
GSFRKDFRKAQKYFMISADNGIAEAQYMLGYMYCYGHVEKDIQRSIEYHEMAAAQGYLLSIAWLALLYQIPEYHNYEKAFNYAKIAAECGDTPSEFVLGTMYLSGRGCSPDADKAYMCFKHAAESGAPEAKLMLMQMDESGI